MFASLPDSLEVNRVSEKALRFNDRSPLENHSACVGFDMLCRHGVLDGLACAERAPFRKLFLGAILATDMSLHESVLRDGAFVLRAIRTRELRFSLSLSSILG